MTDLSGKTALVTGAGQGIGRASAIALAGAGCRVIATNRTASKVAGLEGVEGIECRALDVRDPDAIAAVTSAAGPVDILFNCAGLVHPGTILQSTDEDLDDAFDANVRSMVRIIRAVLPGMLERGDGTIINTSSVVSSVKGVPNRFVYSISKAAIIGLTKALAADYIGQGIRCNAICPGTVDTPSLHERMAASGDYERAHAGMMARQPIGRFCSAEEVADLVVYLAGATYTTGQCYVIDGGWSL
jgi:2-keto-3-deoxy-L-fuconate dehydrogenase